MAQYRDVESILSDDSQEKKFNFEYSSITKNELKYKSCFSVVFYFVMTINDNLKDVYFCNRMLYFVFVRC